MKRMPTRLMGIIGLTLLCQLPVAAKTPVWLNTGMNNRDITFSPDGKLLLTTVMAPRNLTSVIAISQQRNGQWTPLEVAPFSGSYPDMEAAFTPDGLSVYFASRRPVAGKGSDDWDLWRVAFRPDGTWGEPEHLGEPVNTDKNEFYPSLTNKGVLYFTATREDSVGFEDLYRAIPDGPQFTVIENVGEPVNSAAYEFNAFIAPDESYLVFGAQRRPGETGGGDLYISFRQDGTFSAPRLLNADINSTRLDYCPTVFQGRLYFTTEASEPRPVGSLAEMTRRYREPGNGLGDIYWVSFEQIVDPATIDAKAKAAIN